MKKNIVNGIQYADLDGLFKILKGPENINVFQQENNGKSYRTEDLKKWVDTNENLPIQSYTTYTTKRGDVTIEPLSWNLWYYSHKQIYHEDKKLLERLNQFFQREKMPIVMYVDNQTKKNWTIFDGLWVDNKNAAVRSLFHIYQYDKMNNVGNITSVFDHFFGQLIENVKKKEDAYDGGLYKVMAMIFNLPHEVLVQIPESYIDKAFNYLLETDRKYFKIISNAADIDNDKKADDLIERIKFFSESNIISANKLMFVTSHIKLPDEKAEGLYNYLFQKIKPEEYLQTFEQKSIEVPYFKHFLYHLKMAFKIQAKDPYQEAELINVNNTPKIELNWFKAACINQNVNFVKWLKEKDLIQNFNIMDDIQNIKTQAISNIISNFSRIEKFNLTDQDFHESPKREHIFELLHLLKDEFRENYVVDQELNIITRLFVYNQFNKDFTQSVLTWMKDNIPHEKLYSLIENAIIDIDKKEEKVFTLERKEILESFRQQIYLTKDLTQTKKANVKTL